MTLPTVFVLYKVNPFRYRPPLLWWSEPYMFPSSLILYLIFSEYSSILKYFIFFFFISLVITPFCRYIICNWNNCVFIYLMIISRVAPRRWPTVHPSGSCYYICSILLLHYNFIGDAEIINLIISHTINGQKDLSRF